MCQIIGLSNVKGLTKKELNTIAVTAAELVKSQRDGFGFAYATKSRGNHKHTYYCEKYVKPQYFNGIGSVGYNKKSLQGLASAVDFQCMSSGHPDAPTGAFIAHGRIATNNKTVENTHPFRKKGYAMVHNGIVDFDADEYDYKQLYKRYSSCDSEWLLNSYVYEQGHNTWRDYLTGYAATMTITPDNTFIVAKGDRASLFTAALPKLNNGCLVFATKSEHIKALARALEQECTSVFEIKDNWASIIKPNGQVITEQFKPMEGFSAGSIGYQSATKAFNEPKNYNNKNKGYKSNRKVTTIPARHYQSEFASASYELESHEK